MQGISEHAIEDTKLQKWPQSASALMLEYAEKLFTPEHPLYMSNSKQDGVFREVADEYDTYLLKRFLFNLDEQNYVDDIYDWASHRNALALLEKTVKHVVKNDKACHVALGWLIKDCMNKGEIIDLTDPAILLCHEKLRERLHMAVKNDPIIPGEINACFQQFLNDLRRVDSESAGKTAYIVSTFIRIAFLVAKDWEAQRHDDESPQMRYVSMLLGPSLFYALQLNGKIASGNDDVGTRLESHVYKVAMLDILLSMDPLHAHDMSIVKSFHRKREVAKNRPELKKTMRSFKGLKLT